MGGTCSLWSYYDSTEKYLSVHAKLGSASVPIQESRNYPGPLKLGSRYRNLVTGDGKAYQSNVGGWGKSELSNSKKIL